MFISFSTENEINGSFHEKIHVIFYLKGQIAKSHLITDYFFSSSFEGKMPWKGGSLTLYNDGFIINQQEYQDESEIENILEDLTKEAKKLNKEKRALNIIKQIQLLAK